MGDPSYYGGAPDRGPVTGSTFPGYLSSEPLPLASRHIPVSTEFQAVSSDFPRREVNPLWPGWYGMEDTAGIGVRPETSIGGAMAAANGKGYLSPLQDHNLRIQRGDASISVASSIPEAINGMPTSSRHANGASVPRGESNILFVDGLPTDCTRREVGHLFRPFIGYKDIKVIHKGPRRSRDRPTVLCFVEFGDAKCALTAMEALQGYKFDDKKPDSLGLKIQFAHFPFCLPSDRDDQRIGTSC